MQERRRQSLTPEDAKLLAKELFNELKAEAYRYAGEKFLGIIWILVSGLALAGYLYIESSRIH